MEQTNANKNDAHHFIKSISRCQHTDWDLCEIIRLQELNETRQRASQMENTMRWWSQCTANWRQKWDTVRHERNRVRDELLRVQGKLKDAKEEIRRLNETSVMEKKILAQKLQKVGNCFQSNKVDSTGFVQCNDCTTQTEHRSEKSMDKNDIDNHCRQRINELEIEQIKALETIAQLRLDNAKLIDQLSRGHANFVPDTSSESSSQSSNVSSSYSSARSTFSPRHTPSMTAAFTTRGETLPKTTLYQYGGKGSTRVRRNSFC